MVEWLFPVCHIILPLEPPPPPTSPHPLPLNSTRYLLAVKEPSAVVWHQVGTNQLEQIQFTPVAAGYRCGELCGKVQERRLTLPQRDHQFIRLTCSFA
jgi:hypothetical protein